MLALSLRPAGVNGVGPSWPASPDARRDAGRLQYTTALQGSGLTWDAQTFDQFMTDPSKIVRARRWRSCFRRRPDAPISSPISDAEGQDRSARADAAAVAKIKGPSQADSTSAAAATENWLYPLTIMPARATSPSGRSRRRTPRT